MFDEKNGTVEVENLFEPILADYEYKSEIVKGRLEDGKIVFDVATYYKEDGATILGTNEWGDYVALLGGTLVNNPDGTQGVNLETTLALNMSEDKSEVATDKVVVLYEMSEDYGEGILYDFRYGMKWNRLSEVAVSSLNTSEIDFGSVYYMENSTVNLVLSSLGAMPVKFNVSIDDTEHFSTEITTGNCYYGKPVSIPVKFTPGKVGTYNGKISIEAADQTYTVNVTGIGKDATRDFSSLITEGDKSFFYNWQNNSPGPWELDEDVAVNTNAKRTGMDAVLSATYTADNPKLLTFDYSVQATGIDSLIVYVDQARMMGYADKVTGTAQFQIPQGEHTVTWIFRKVAKSPGKDFVELYNVRITDAEEYSGVSPDNSVKVGNNTAWTQYGQWLRPTGRNASVELKVVNAGTEGCIDFDAEATADAPLNIYVDNELVKTVSQKGACAINLDGIGEHTIKVTFTGSDDENKQKLFEEYTGISNIRAINEHFVSTDLRYVLVGDSYFNTDGEYTPTDGILGVNCPVDVTYTNTGRFILKNLFPVKGILYQPVEGRIEGGKVIINAKASTNEGSCFAYDNQTSKYEGYLGNRWWLTAGTINGKKSKKDFNLVDALEMEIEGDMEILKPSTGFGIWLTYRYNNSGMTEFLKKGARFEKATEQPNVITSAPELDFGHAFTETGSFTKKNVVINKSLVNTDCAIEMQGSYDFKAVPNTFELAPLSSQTVEVTYTPITSGNINATMHVYSDGNDCSVTLKASAEEKPDYGQMVSKGKEMVTGWNTSADYPWMMDGNEAYSTNKNHHNTTSELFMTFKVPEGKIARFSFDADLAVECEGDFFHVKMDKKDIVYMDQNKRDLVGVEIVGEGEHTVVFAHEKDGVTLLPSEDVTKIRNIAIELYDAGEKVAMTHAPRYHYDMIVPIDKGDQTYVWVINKGTADISFTGAEVEAPFQVECPTESVAPGDTIAVPVFINPQEPGHYFGNICLKSTAGDIRCTIDAKADYVRYLGGFDGATLNFPVCSYYVNYGVYPIYTQSLYSAEELEGLKGAQFEEITYLTYFEGDIDFTATDVNYRIGETDDNDISNGHPEALTTIYQGEQLDIVNFEQTIPFSTPYVYQGGNLLLAHDLNSKEGFSIQVYYYSGLEGSGMSGIYLPDTPSFGLMKNNSVPAVRIKYVPATQSGMTFHTAKTVKSVRYYNALGIQQDMLGKGMNIIVTEYSDGSKHTRKRILQ